MTQKPLPKRPRERSRLRPGIRREQPRDCVLGISPLTQWLLMATLIVLAGSLAPAEATAQYYQNNRNYNPRSNYRQHQTYRPQPQYVAQAQRSMPARQHRVSNKRHGRVLMIRGAFTVFSLGLDTLAGKMRKQGLDVVVSTAATSTLNANALAEEYRRNPSIGPIVIIGHSRGGLLAPDVARAMGQAGVPVELVVIVDNTHSNLMIPKNVRRAVNFYQTDALTLIEGQIAFGEGPAGQVSNINIETLPGRDSAGYIDHFNIEESAWVHQLVMQQVFEVCPRYGEERSLPQPEQELVRREAAQAQQASAQAYAQPTSRVAQRDDPLEPVRTVDPAPAVRTSRSTRSNTKLRQPMFDYFEGVDADDYWKK